MKTLRAVWWWLVVGLATVDAVVCCMALGDEPPDLEDCTPAHTAAGRVGGRDASGPVVGLLVVALVLTLVTALGGR